MSIDAKAAIDGLASAFEEFKKRNDEQLAEIKKKGVADPLLAEQVKRISDDVAAMQETVTELGKKSQRINAGGDYSDEDETHRKAFSQWARRGIDSDVLREKSMSIGTAADGGYTVPKVIDNAIHDLLVNVSPIRSIASVVSISTSDYRKLVNIHGASGGWVGETAARPATNTSQFAEVPAILGENYANAPITQRLLEDSQFDMEAFLTSELALDFAVKEGAAFVAGTGTNQPKGFLAYTTAATADGVRAFGTIEHVATGVAGDFAASNKGDVLISLIYKLKAGHRNNATWVTNKGILGEVRGFKDTTGQYLWAPGLAAGQPSTLLGYPVVEAEDMPAKAANALSMAFGNFRAGYEIVDRVGTSVLRDPYTNKPYVNFYARRVVGGMVVDSEAIKVLKFAVA